MIKISITLSVSSPKSLDLLNETFSSHIKLYTFTDIVVDEEPQLVVFKLFNFKEQPNKKYWLACSTFSYCGKHYLTPSLE